MDLGNDSATFGGGGGCEGGLGGFLRSQEQALLTIAKGRGPQLTLPRFQEQQATIRL